jgi:uncharacterized protein YjbJ (UPF0337 family)
MRSRRRDKAQGTIDRIAGKVMETFGKATGSHKTRATGKAARGRGAGRSAKGRAKGVRR